LRPDDADEPDDGLLSGAHCCEKPGGWEAVESMARRTWVLGEKEGATASTWRRGTDDGNHTYLRAHPTYLSATTATTTGPCRNAES
jgi:hypothetical protein